MDTVRPSGRIAFSVFVGWAGHTTFWAEETEHNEPESRESWRDIECAALVFQAEARGLTVEPHAFRDLD